MRRLLLFLILAGLASCSSGTVMDPAYGINYFDDQFECTTGPVEQEKDEKYHLRRLAYINHLKTLPEPPPRSRILLAGESTAALFSEDLLKEFLPEYNTMNRAIPGETTVVFLANLDQLVIRHRPKVIVLAIGGNDILGGRCLSTILRNTEIILDTIHRKLPGTKVLLVSIPPVVSWKVSSIAGHLNMGFQQLTNRKSFAQFVDLWPLLADEKRPVLDEKYQLYLEDKDKMDQVHFNKEGYRRFAEAIRPFL